jgi:hypothetical protein
MINCTYLIDLTIELAERAGFEPARKTGFPMKRGVEFALEAAQIRLFATRFATIAKAGI